VFRLFDLQQDPREVNDLSTIPEHQNRCREMSDQIGDYYARYSLAEKSGTRPGGPEPTNCTSPWNLEDN